MPHKLSPRLKTFDYLGCYPYFLTICTYDRLVSSLTINPSASCSCSYRVRPAINGLWLLRTASCPITSTYWSKEIIRLLTFVSSCVSSSSDRRLRGSKEVEQRSGSEATSSTY